MQYTREFTQERNPLNVKNVGKPSPISHISLYISEFTQEKNPMNVKNVVNVFQGNITSLSMRLYTGNNTDVKKCRKALFLQSSLTRMREIV